MAPPPQGSSPKRPPVCGREFDGKTCRRRGDHHCKARVDHVLAFFRELLVHTKGTYAGKPFIPTDWQTADILAPIFGTVYYSTEHRQYIRRYTVAWIEIARKNGKSELLAAIMLYLLVADGEESAELYGCARDRDQASLAFDVAARMVELSPILRRRLVVRRPVKRIFDPKTNSVYQVIAADAAGALGSNPSGVAADEILAWRNRSMWDAMRTGMGSGARRQPLMVAATTAGNDPSGFAAAMHKEMQRVQDDPARQPHVFAFLRNTPKNADPFDEANWYHANPALGDFLSLAGMREAALEAKSDPGSENAFRQFRLNQWVQQTTRYIPLHLWDANAGDDPVDAEALAGHRCWAGLDLSSKLDMTAWCLLFGDGSILWRFWCPESVAPKLDEATGGAFTGWVRDGLVQLTDGDAIDYDAIYADIDADHRRYRIAEVSYDRWCGEPVRQEIVKRTGLELHEAGTTYSHMTSPMTELLRLLTETELHHGGHAVARWHADSIEAKSPADDPDRIRPVKPIRDASGKRIDGMIALLLAIDARMRGRGEQRSAYEDDDLMVV